MSIMTLKEPKEKENSEYIKIFNKDSFDQSKEETQ